MLRQSLLSQLIKQFPRRLFFRILDRKVFNLIQIELFVQNRYLRDLRRSLTLWLLMLFPTQSVIKVLSCFAPNCFGFNLFQILSSVAIVIIYEICVQIGVVFVLIFIIIPLRILMLQMIISRVINTLFLSESTRYLRLLFWRFTFAAKNYRSLDATWKWFFDDFWHRILLSDGFSFCFEACDGFVFLWPFYPKVAAEHVVIIHQLVFIVYYSIICKSLLLADWLTKTFLRSFIRI